MVEIKPFPAIIYNHTKVHQLSKVICPPYDIISDIEARFYRRLSSYNMIHLTLPKQTSGQDRYQKAASYFNNWLERKILRQEKQPAIYFYQQEFKIGQINSFPIGKGSRLKRLGFIACLDLHSSPSIYGHEHTRIEPKEDRFKLLVKVRANLEPIFVLFSDAQRFIEGIFEKYVLPDKPLIYFRDQEKNINTLWRLDNPLILKKIKAAMANKILFIADGHHRYEVSLNYQDMMYKTPTSTLGGEDFNYIMAYFCPIQSTGLVIRPVHRLVKGVENCPIEKFEQFFHIHKTTRSQLFNLMHSRASKQRIIGIYANRHFYIAILKNKQTLNRIDKHRRCLDISLLNQLVLSKLLKIEPDNRERIIFSASAQDLIRQADIDRTSLVFFLKSVDIADIVELAKKGKKMPAKTTYFYPKVPSGLVMYKFEEK